MVRYGGVDRVEPDQRPGWCRVAMHFDSEEVACHSLLAFGSRVDVLEPRTVADRIAAEARSLVARMVERGATS